MVFLNSTPKGVKRKPISDARMRYSYFAYEHSLGAWSVMSGILKNPFFVGAYVIKGMYPPNFMFQRQTVWTE